jgi:alkylation response protein AidB-like acyl-CoA dehydrogenase
VNLSGATAGIGGTPVPVGSRQKEVRETTTVRDFVQRGSRAATPRSGLPQGRRTDREGRAERLFELAKSRGVIDNAVIRQDLMRYHTNQQVSRLNMLRSRGAAAVGNRPGPEGSVGKLLRSRITRGNRDLGPTILGAHALLWDDPHSPDDGQSVRATLSAPSSSIAGGTDEVQANIIGERVLGLPKEPSVDADVPFKELRVGTQRAT